VVEQKLKKMYGGRARAKKCKMVEQKLKKKMRDGRAKKCAMDEQKLNKKCEMVGQKNVRWPSKS
jgi:hypothetical protein